jgi:hypothetical protein
LSDISVEYYAFDPGDLVSFDWWSSYMAPLAMLNENGNIIWTLIEPGDMGLVVHSGRDSSDNGFDVIVMFNESQKLVRMHSSMLMPCDGPKYA